MPRFASALETTRFAVPSRQDRVFTRLTAFLRSLSGAGRQQQRIGSLDPAARHDSGAGRDLQDYAVAPPTASARRLHATAEAARWTLPRL